MEEDRGGQGTGEEEGRKKEGGSKFEMNANEGCVVEDFLFHSRHLFGRCIQGKVNCFKMFSSDQCLLRSSFGPLSVSPENNGEMEGRREWQKKKKGGERAKADNAGCFGVSATKREG